ncbi:low specificity L-threonine aldolase [Enterococcus sp. ALS3]|uniref:Low specificity L-threonine aldolase n=1 Tax=Enterococcus alishanensis TaxID=1303817 RepID=A0ABS6TG94_9ENTE|nr:low specificity L-threonine aldolase [Enterococcus alishanensis]MBV7391982.1 low specificity L-threonine aldolase [Enterococcus alishanensis]
MISFENDYLEGAHERILHRLIATNMIQEAGYGEDDFSAQAAEKIKSAIACPDATIRFLVGGTQTNQIVIDSVLQPYEGVIAAETGHISTHEAGAIEFSGHKVLSLPAKEGKIKAEDVDNLVETFYQDANYQHMVFPGMVYISYPTEYGTLYSKKELEALAAVCQKHKIPLYLDGARLGYGLASPSADVTIQDIARLCDIFYIGGTKIGALCGEAIVFTKNNEPKNFTTLIKQHGALLAKGRLIGIQFLELFSDNLYFDISQHAIDMAMKLKTGMLAKGYQQYLDSPTNQQFFVMPNEKINELQEKIKFARWEKYDDTRQIVRFATCWATKEENIDALLALL